MIVCLDTSVLIWGVRGVSEPHDAHQVPKAQALIAKLDSEGANVIIPIPVAIEYISRSAHPERELEALARGFELHALDIPAALAAAKIEGDREAFKQAQGLGAVARPCLKVDAQIIAIALTAGAEVIYTENLAEFRKLAKSQIKISPIPDLPPVQMSLFEDEPTG